MMVKLAFFMIVILAVVAGCSGVPGVEISPAQAAQTILEKGGFSDTSALRELPEYLVPNYYQIDDTVIEHSIIVDGSGASAREIAVLRISDINGISKAREILEGRVRALEREFENYQPGEMEKIKNAVIITRGNMAYLVVTDEPQKAKDAIESLYKS